MGSSEAGRVVVITGVSEGIGYGMATALLGDGYRVAGFDVDGTNPEALGGTPPSALPPA